MKKTKKALFWILIVVLLGVFLFSAFSIGNYIFKSVQSKSLYDDLNQLVDAKRPARPQVTEPIPTLPNSTTAPTEPAQEPEFVTVTNPKTGEELQVLPEYAELYQKNCDVVGWIQLPGTTISYPVMQTPDNPNYYLKRSFDHKFNERGCVYAREECDVNKPSDNIVIYGHHFEDGSMFSPLLEYWDRDFYLSHKYIYFDTLFERHTYEVIAVFRTTAVYGEGFRYHLFCDAGSAANFDEYVDTCKALGMYDVEATAEYGDKLITLSTCDFSQDNGRMVIVAKRVA